MKIKLQTKTKDNAKNVRVRVVKAPIVDNRLLKQIIFARTKALVL